MNTQAITPTQSERRVLLAAVQQACDDMHSAIASLRTAADTAKAHDFAGLERKYLAEAEAIRQVLLNHF